MKMLRSLASYYLSPFFNSLSPSFPRSSSIYSSPIPFTASPSFFSLRGLRNYSRKWGIRHRNIRDQNRRLLYQKYELQRNLYKALTYDSTLPEEAREHFRCKLSQLPRNSSITRVRNRCVLTGRSRAIYRKFRISRICFRELARRGELMGVRKASW